MGTNIDSPKAFISYSWDDEIHKKWVLELAHKLTKNGVYVFFDRFDLHAGKDMINFIDTSMRESNKVLLIMTPNYKIRSEKDSGGVRAEYSMIASEIFNNHNSDKFIPIVRLGERNIITPGFLKSKISIDMRDDDKFEASFEVLLRTIYNRHEINRPIAGKPPKFVNATKSNDLSNQNTIVDKDHSITNRIELDTLRQYENYSGGLIPEIEQFKYHLTTYALAAQIRHEYLKVIEYKLTLAEICQSQDKKDDAYLLEEGIRKTYEILSSMDKKEAKKMISEYNLNMAMYIDQDIEDSAGI